jgi:hypothetical protein
VSVRVASFPASIIDAPLNGLGGSRSTTGALDIASRRVASRDQRLDEPARINRLAYASPVGSVAAGGYAVDVRATRHSY